jgi:hypothetical protein
VEPRDNGNYVKLVGRDEPCLVDIDDVNAMAAAGLIEHWVDEDGNPKGGEGSGDTASVNQEQQQSPSEAEEPAD